METESVLLFFKSPDGVNLWEPVPREEIPEWLRDDEIIQRLMAGEVAHREEDDPAVYYTATELERRPVQKPAPQRQVIEVYAGIPADIRRCH